jgi:hypothetical protein
MAVVPRQLILRGVVITIRMAVVRRAFCGATEVTDAREVFNGIQPDLFRSGAAGFFSSGR